MLDQGLDALVTGDFGDGLEGDSAPSHVHDGASPEGVQVSFVQVSDKYWRICII